MTDREALLQVIRDNPDDELPRRVYADYLEEFPTGRDIDVATVEFIRLSCRPVNGNVRIMPREVYPWLDANWKRLLPNVLALHHPRKQAPPNANQVLQSIYAIGEEYRRDKRNGRKIRTLINPDDNDWASGYSVTFEFWKGFVIGVER